MRNALMFLVAAGLAACAIEQDGVAAAQAVAGPGGVTVAATLVAGELAVSWSADPAAWKYYVLQSTSGPGGPFVDAASVLDPSQLPPAPTRWTATGLASGSYCYAVRSAYIDGTTSELGAVACGTPRDGGPAAGGDVTDTILGEDFKATTGSVAYVDGRILTLSAATIVARLPLRTGDRLKSITSIIGGDGQVDAPLYSVLLITDGVPSTLASTSLSDLLFAEAHLDVPDTTLAVGQAVLVKVASSAALLVLDDVRYTYDHPVQ